MPYYAGATAGTQGIAGRVLSQNESNQVKRLTQMQQYQIIKGTKNSFYDGQNGNMMEMRPLSHGENQIQAPGDFALGASGIN